MTCCLEQHLADFVATINADPTDATVKLVYADALEETGFPVDAEAWRWLGRKWRHPVFNPGGVAYGPQYSYGINWSWSWMFDGAYCDDPNIIPMCIWDAGQYTRLRGLPGESMMMAWTQGPAYSALDKIVIAWHRLLKSERLYCWGWEPRQVAGR